MKKILLVLVGFITIACTGSKTNSGNESGQSHLVFKKSTEPLYEGMYTITGNGYNDYHQYDSPTSCQAMYVKVYENKLITTVSAWGSPDYIDINYEFEGVDNTGKRIYRNGDTAFLVDSVYDIEKVISTYTYNGNKRTDTHWEVVKGDYSEDCLRRLEGALEFERMKSTMDLDY